MVHNAEVSENEEKEFEEFIHTKIKEFNNVESPLHREARKPGSSTPLFIMLKDDAGHILGGLSASTYWDWLVSAGNGRDDCRRKGL